jgi:hypothetical protein
LFVPPRALNDVETAACGWCCATTAETWLGKAVGLFQVRVATKGQAQSAYSSIRAATVLALPTSAVPAPPPRKPALVRADFKSPVAPPTSMHGDRHAPLAFESMREETRPRITVVDQAAFSRMDSEASGA